MGTLGAPWSLVHMRGRGYGGVPTTGHALQAEVGGGIPCATLGELSGLCIVVPFIAFRVMGVIPWLLQNFS